MIEAKAENLIGDRAYDSDPLDEELRNDGIEMIAPHHSNRSKPHSRIARAPACQDRPARHRVAQTRFSWLAARRA